MIRGTNKISWKKDQLWRGCMLASIANAVMAASNPDFSYEHSWDGMNYSTQDTQGNRGTITFTKDFCIGAFRSDYSSRINPEIRSNHVDKYFQGAPKEIINISKEETLEYLLEDINGEIFPLITTAFWGDNLNLFSSDGFDDMYEQGGFLLETQAMDFKDALGEWEEYYEMSSNQLKLVEILYNRKVINNQKQIILGKEEIKLLEYSDLESLEESRISFKEINIFIE